MSERTDQAPETDLVKDLRDGQNLLPPRAALAELVVLLGLIVGASWVFPNVDVTQLQPNPFWLPVLVLSLQYGTVSGLLAAACAIAITLLVFPTPEQENGENLFIYAARTFAQPVLWIAAAVLLGQFRMRQIEAKRDLVKAVDMLTRQRASLSKYAEGLRARCDSLEREIVGRTTPPVHGALATLAGLYSAKPENDDLARALERGLEAVFPGARGFLLTRSSTGAPVIAVSHGRLTYPLAEKDLETLAQLVFDQGRSLDVLTRDGEVALGGLGMLAVPVPDTAAGRETARIAALVVDGIAPADMGAASTAAAMVLARALAPAVTSAGAVKGVVASLAIAREAARPEGSTPHAANGAAPPVLADRARASRSWAKFGWLPQRGRETRSENGQALAESALAVDEGIRPPPAAAAGGKS